METLSAAMNRLRKDGYLNDFSAARDGQLRCPACGALEAPEEMTVDETVRFEGASDPGDQEILLAITCGCGTKGQYSAAYGPATPFEDVAVLRRLSTRPRTS